MPDTDAPPVEPLTLTLEEAMLRIAGDTEWRLTSARSPHYGLDWLLVTEAGEVGHVFRDWDAAATEALGRPVVERDDTAELVEALERLLANEPMPFIGHTPGAFVILVTEADIATARAALARVKGGERS